MISSSRGFLFHHTSDLVNVRPSLGELDSPISVEKARVGVAI
ncbi:MAG: hypothetical protein ACRDA8_11565 [Shewanella sp.]